MFQLCQLPTWNAFNSFLIKTPSVTLRETLPLSPISTTDWTGLYTALKKAQGINMKVSPNKKTIMTLNLQLNPVVRNCVVKMKLKQNFFGRKSYQ